MGQALDVVLGPHRFLYIDRPELRPLKPQFDALLLSPNEIGQLYDIFNTIDTDRSGSVTVSELFAHLATEATYFRDRVFTLFDDDSSGKIDFREFVLSLWNYCTLSKASLVMFAFDLYDTDSTGELSAEEIQGMLVDLYGKQAQTHPQAKQIVKELNALDQQTTINVDRFRAFVVTHPALLFPAFQMQLALRQHVLGVQFWNRCSQKRIKLIDGRRITLEKLLEINVHEEAFLSVLQAHEAAVEEERQKKLAAYQQSRYANKAQTESKSRSKSIVDWISLQRQFSKYRVADAPPSAKESKKVELPVVQKPTKTSFPLRSMLFEKEKVKTLTLQPKDEMALLVLQVTGTHHYRRIWTQYHLKHGATTDGSTAVMKAESGSGRTEETSQHHHKHKQQQNHHHHHHQSPQPQQVPHLKTAPSHTAPVFVAPPLLTLSATTATTATALALNPSGASVSSHGHITSAATVTSTGSSSSSSSSSTSIGAPPNAQVFQILLNGDALQRQHKFVEIGVIAIAKRPHENAAAVDSHGNTPHSTPLPSAKNSPRPAAAAGENSVSLHSRPSVHKTATAVASTESSDVMMGMNAQMNRKEVIQWQAKMVEYSGILNHVTQHQQSGSEASTPTKKHRQHHDHHHGGGGVRLIGELAGDDVSTHSRASGGSRHHKSHH